MVNKLSNQTTGGASQGTQKSTSGGCSHLVELLDGSKGSQAGEDLLARYGQVSRWGLKLKGVGQPQKREPVRPPPCSTCNKPLSRPFACLSCPFVGCFHDASHTLEHLKTSGHHFSVDAKTGSVFCMICQDFVYEERLDAVINETRQDLEIPRGMGSWQKSKRKRQKVTPFVPTAQEAALLARAGPPLSCRGIRGILNLGQTCFLSVVLQTFLHNPLLRNHFLADRHNRYICAETSAASDTKKDCMCCEMDRMFADFYSDDRSPWGPVTFLSSMWSSSSDLAGYAQQDAHEFFISALNQMHTNSHGSKLIDCSCPVHTTFAGQLQSDVCCGSCGQITSAFDPMLDISLDLKSKAGVVADGENTLAKSLRRYTSPEKLGQQYLCDKCGVSSLDATKQLSLHQLPPVLCIQFKRFEHSSTSSQSTKIDTPIRFPSKIDLTPYTTAAVQARRNGDEPVVGGPGEEMVWDLFAVVKHQGQLNTGHYTNFAKFKDEWYFFDDEKVGPSSLGIVLSCKPFVLPPFS
ncbi:hypothetical protein BDY24DRAFT_336151 [Mrakia frigida]|uniref:UBP-type zinc finger domain-containing protein n=1 Tax=Mrakia frigida TaxID=29902 RepID=UPI003FCBF083